MNKQKLKLYYTYFIPITILQSIASLLMITFYSVNDYGTITLYLTNINLLFFLTLGIQLGYTLIKDIDKRNSAFTNSVNLFVNLFICILMLATIIIHLFLPMSNITLFSLLSGELMVLFILHKSIFQTNYEIHSLNIYVILFRLIFIVDIFVYILRGDIVFTIFVDCLQRFILASIGNLIIYMRYPHTNLENFKVNKSAITRVIHLGIPVMLGNWITMLYLLADKYVLRSNLEMLGYYSFAITIVLFLRVLITPLKDLIFVNMAHQSELVYIVQNLYRCLVVGSIFTIIGLASTFIGFNYFGLFSRYQLAFNSVYILLGLIPISISLDIFIFNYVRVKNGKLFLIKTIFCGLVMFLSLYNYTNLTTDFNLSIFSTIVLLNYLFIYFIFLYNAISKKELSKLFALLVLFEVLLLSCIILI